MQRFGRRIGAVSWVLALVLGASPALAEASGDRVAYLGRTAGLWQVWTMAPDGSDARQLTTSMTEKTRVAWMPGGQELIVSTQGGRVFRVDAESGAETLVPLTIEGALDAVPSPDGRTLAFSVSPAVSRDDNEIFVARLDGSGLRKLTNQPRVQHEPAWTLDGRAIYYLSSEGEDHNLWKVAADGSSREQLTVGRGFYLDVTVGPDGSLAYSNNVTDDYEIWIDPADGEPRQLTDMPGLDGSPSFSPDGQQILFESGRTGQLELWRVPTAGGEAVQVTSGEGARRPAWWGPR